MGSGTLLPIALDSFGVTIALTACVTDIKSFDISHTCCKWNYHVISIALAERVEHELVASLPKCTSETMHDYSYHGT